MQIVTSWMEEGIEQGLQQGLQQGVQQEALNFTLRLLSRRFGAVAPELLLQIRALSVLQLEDLGEALLDFSAPADLEIWLARLSDDSVN